MKHRFGFSKNDRIRKHREYKTLSSTGKKHVSSNFVVLFTPGVNLHSRLGVTVSRRVGTAIVRNRMKRVIRELFRRNRDLLLSPVDMNVIVRRKAAALTFEEVSNEIKKIFDDITSSTCR